MRKIWIGILLIGILAGCSQKEAEYSKEELLTNDNYGPASPVYDIVAEYDDVQHVIDGRLSVSFTNNIEVALDVLYFNLWPNAEIFEEGGMDISQVTMDSAPLDYAIDGTAMEVTGFSLGLDEQAEIDMKFTVMIPELPNRFGWYGDQVSLGNWFPILAVQDRHGWNTPPYFASGESFYSLTGDYDVTLHVPSTLQVLATGEQQEEPADGTVRFTAENVRDFAMVLNTPYRSLQENIDGTEVAVHYREGEEAEADVIMRAAHDSLPVYNHLFGEYPWKTLDLITVDYSNEFDGGMEYPQLVTINSPYIADDEELALTAAHEIAHQWFYSLVGNDSYGEPWLDESLTTFASYIVTGQEPNFSWQAADDYSLTASAADFGDDDGAYGDVVYDGGAKMLGRLRDELGEDIFSEGLKTYVQEMKYNIATTADFIRIMQDVSGMNLRPFFEENRLYIEETR